MLVFTMLLTILITIGSKSPVESFLVSFIFFDGLPIGLIAFGNYLINNPQKYTVNTNTGMENYDPNLFIVIYKNKGYTYDTACELYCKKFNKNKDEISEKENKIIWNCSYDDIVYLFMWIVENNFYQYFSYEYGDEDGEEERWMEFINKIKNRQEKPTEYFILTDGYLFKKEISSKVWDFIDKYYCYATEIKNGHYEIAKGNLIGAYEVDLENFIKNELNSELYGFDFEWKDYDKFKQNIDKAYERYKKMNLNYDERIEKIAEEVKKATKQDIYEIQVNGNSVELFDSKFGGVPYWDLSRNYPVNSSGEKLILLAQINLEKENFEDSRLPNKGILQFFVENKFNTSDKEMNKVIYHKEINKNITQEDIMKLGIPTTLNPNIDIGIKNQYKLTFRKKQESISIKDYRFYDFVKEACNKLYKEENNENGLPEWIDQNELFDYFTDGKGHKMFGYPHFCQADSRTANIINEYNNIYNKANRATYKEEEKLSWLPTADKMKKINESNIEIEKLKQKKEKEYDTLLLQIDSCEFFRWGDNGQVNIFINKEDLKECSFDDVFWNLDSY